MEIPPVLIHSDKFVLSAKILTLFTVRNAGFIGASVTRCYSGGTLVLKPAKEY